MAEWRRRATRPWQAQSIMYTIWKGTIQGRSDPSKKLSQMLQSECGLGGFWRVPVITPNISCQFQTTCILYWISLSVEMLLFVYMHIRRSMWLQSRIPMYGLMTERNLLWKPFGQHNQRITAGVPSSRHRLTRWQHLSRFSQMDWSWPLQVTISSIKQKVLNPCCRRHRNDATCL